MVSVIVPSYNSSKSIIQCLDSINDQTYDDVEVIVVDDGSTDDSCRLIERYIQTHNRFHHNIVKQKNSGPAAARNRGIGLSQGELIAFLDADDQWLPAKLERQVRMFEDNQDLSMIGTRYFVGHASGETHKRKGTDIRNISLRQLSYRNYFMTSTVMVRRQVFEHLCFDESQRYSEDYRLWLEICANFSCGLSDSALTVMADKPLFGKSGLSSELWQMEKHELLNHKHLYMSTFTPPTLYLSAIIFSFLKFIRRYLITAYNIGKASLDCR